MIEQYRDELVMSLQGNLDEQQAAEDREVVARDLLNILHRFASLLLQPLRDLSTFFSIPIQSIATNGPSLVHKVRFVASTLLDAVRKAETAPASAARAHAYLCQPHFLIKSSHFLTNISGDFLSILSEIERNYLCVLLAILPKQTCSLLCPDLMTIETELRVEME